VSLQKIIICLCRPARLTLSPSYPDPCQLWSYWVAGPCPLLAVSIPTRAWLPRRSSAVDSEWISSWITAASCWTALMVAGQLRRLDSIKLARLLPLELRPKLRLVHATSAAESSRPTPCDSDSESASLQLSGCRRTRMSLAVGCPPPLPPPFSFARIWVSTPSSVSYLPAHVSICMYIACICTYIQLYVCIQQYTYVYVCICMYMYV